MRCNTIFLSCVIFVFGGLVLLSTAATVLSKYIPASGMSSSLALLSSTAANTNSTLDEVAVLNSKGVSLFNLGKYEEAIAYYDKALTVDPNYATALSNKGSALNELGRHEEAIACYDKALAIDPNYEDAINNKRKVLDIIGSQNITSSELPLNNRTIDSNSTINIINNSNNKLP